MPDEIQNQTTQNPQTTQTTPSNTGVLSEVASKIADAENILVALSSDPSVDEMAAAIGLSLYLDKLGKRATAIYSGTTPNALEFLKPEETFESTADALQDFVIALNKEKADHLRYKLDGDFVKIFITPYRSRISEDDLDFSYGDFNIDLVLALDVANGIDLDSALREHGRIMHDAIVINITTGNPGKLGEIEWSDTSASSVSEMIAELIYSMKDVAMDKEEATAFLTGIVAATGRFSTAATTSATMLTASKLMESGANQQLIAKNITSDTDNELLSSLNKKVAEPELKVESESEPEEAPAASNSGTDLDIKHSDEEKPEATTEVPEAESTEKNDDLLDDLKAAEASLATAGAETTPEVVEAPIQIPEENTDTSDALASAAAAVSAAGVAADDTFALPNMGDGSISNAEEKKIAPSANFAMEDTNDSATKYGQMLEEALTESEPQAPQPIMNPAISMAPEVPAAPEINGVPEINYMPLPGDEVLPPPPAPPVDFSSSVMPTPSTMPTMEAPAAPTMTEPTISAPTSEPAPAPEPMPAPAPAPTPEPSTPVTPPSNNAFKIPGM